MPPSSHKAMLDRRRSGSVSRQPEAEIATDPDNIPPRSRLFMVVPKTADGSIIEVSSASMLCATWHAGDLQPHLEGAAPTLRCHPSPARLCSYGLHLSDV